MNRHKLSTFKKTELEAFLGFVVLALVTPPLILLLTNLFLFNEPGDPNAFNAPWWIWATLYVGAIVKVEQEAEKRELILNAKESRFERAKRNSAK